MLMYIIFQFCKFFEYNFLEVVHNFLKVIYNSILSKSTWPHFFFILFIYLFMFEAFG